VYDQETNWHRDYEPQTGRYVHSDPIGLAGGLNTYAHASGNPILRIDSNGLLEWSDVSNFGRGFGSDFHGVCRAEVFW
jgi:uncharacterized protein RhaS with RHS repeats